MNAQYQIHGHDKMMDEDYILPTLYDTYDEAHAKARVNSEWVIKIETKEQAS